MSLARAINRIVCVAVFAAVFALLRVCPAAGQLPDGPYFGQDPPGMVPEVFAPEIISLNDRREDRLVFSPDGQQCALGLGDQILYTRQENGHWLPWDDTVFGTNQREPFFGPDGMRFYSLWNAEVYMSEYVLGQWSMPLRLPAPVNAASTGEYLPTASLDGTLYFVSDRDGTPSPGSLAYAIYRAPLVDGAYPEVVKLGSEINGPYGAWDPFIAPDKSYMIFGIDKAQGAETDFYITYAAPDGSWTEAKSLGPPINTDAIEFGPYISYDGNYLFFSRPEGWDSWDQPADILWVDSQAVFAPQACCYPDTTCQDLVDPRVCAAAGGSPRGNGAACLGDGNGDGFDDVCVSPCAPSAQPLDDPQPLPAALGFGTKNRYLSFVGADVGRLQAVQVTFTDVPGFEYANGRTAWVQLPSPVTELPGSSDPAPPPTLMAATLGCTPRYTDWAALGTVHVFDAGIIPGGAYQVRVIDEDSCDCANADHFSQPLAVSMSAAGDVVGDCGVSPCSAPQGVVDFVDVSAVVEKFKNTPGSITKARADIVSSVGSSSVPDGIVDFFDISLVVDGFVGAPAPPPGPPPEDPCPGC
ncbi:MAG: hypothetical protein PVI86_13765 [Phycisphaerae bacterium]|jgi:hypothetical protein